MRLPLIPLCLMVLVGMVGCDDSNEPAKEEVKAKDKEKIKKKPEKTIVLIRPKGFRTNDPRIVNAPNGGGIPVNGLKYILRASQKVIKLGEKIVFKVFVCNVGKAPLNLIDDPDYILDGIVGGNWFVRVDGVDNKETRVSTFAVTYWPTASTPFHKKLHAFHTLIPGKALLFEVEADYKKVFVLSNEGLKKRISNRMDDRGEESVAVVGPNCTPLDVFAQDVQLPHVEVGDLIGVFSSGAYGYTASSLAFLSHPTPAEVMVLEGETHVLRDAGPYEQALWGQNAIDLPTPANPRSATTSTASVG